MYLFRDEKSEDLLECREELERNVMLLEKLTREVKCQN